MSLIACREVCSTDFNQDLSLKINTNSMMTYSPQGLSFLSDPSTVYKTVQLTMNLKGNHTAAENLHLVINGLKMSRWDARLDVDSLTYNAHSGVTVAVVNLQMMSVSGRFSFVHFMKELQAHKGQLEMSLIGKSAVTIASADLDFAGDMYSKCAGAPTPTPTPTPTPVVTHTQITSENPSQSPTTSSTMAISFAANTQGNNFFCSLDGAAYVACTSPQSYSNLKDGSHGFAVYARNAQGVNEATPATYSWTVDAPLPIVQISNSSQLPTLTNSTSISFTLMSSEAVQFLCSLDGATAADCSSPIAYSSVTAGSHNFSVTGVDTAGNVSASAASFQWTVDLTPPVAQFISVTPAETTTNSTSFSAAFNANKSVTFQCALDGATPATCTSPVSMSNIAAGNHSFSVTPTDLAGNIGETISTTWTVDLTPPVLSLSSVVPAAGMTNAKNVTVNFTVDKAATVSCSLDGATAAVCTSPWSATSLAAGTHTVVLTAVDMAGNQGAPVSVSWTMDFTAPLISFGTISPSSNDEINSSSLSVAVTSSKSVTLQATLNGTAVSQSKSPLTLSGLAEGTYTLSVVAVDAAGNTSNTITHTFTVDLTAPTLTVTPSNTNNPTNSDQNSFTFSASETAQFTCSLDGAGLAACQSPYVVSGLANGSHTVQIQGTDLAGNVSTIYSYTWVVDTTPPVTAMTEVAVTGGYTFTLSANKPNVTFYCSLDGGTAVLCTSPVTYANLPNGNHTLTVKAEDAAGNMDPSGVTYNWIVSVSIETTITSVTPSGNPDNSSSITFTFTSNEPGANFTCSLDGATARSCTSPYTIGGLSLGNHTFTVRSFDDNGNSDTVGDTYTWTVNSVGP